MALLKKEIIIKTTSVMTLSQIKVACRGIVNSFQTANTNKKPEGTFIDYFFADIYDARDGNLYRIFSDSCESTYALIKTDGYLFYTLIDKANSGPVTPPETLPGGTNGDNGNTTGDIENTNYEDEYPIELEWSHFSKEVISWSFESFNRPILLETDFTTKTVEQLQEIYGADYNEANIAYYIKVGNNTFENNRYVPVYKTDVVEFENIPAGVPGGEKIDTMPLFNVCTANVSPEVKINDIIQQKLSAGTTSAALIAGLNLQRTIIFGPDAYKNNCFIKINGAYLSNYTSSEEKPTRKRRLVTVLSDLAGSYTTATFNKVGVVPYAASYTITLVDGLFKVGALYKLHNTAQASGGKMGYFLTTSLFIPEIFFNATNSKKLKIKYYRYLNNLYDIVPVDTIKNIVVPYLNINVPDWIDMFAINDTDNINYETLNNELINLYLKHKTNLSLNTTTPSMILLDINSKVLYAAVTDTLDTTKIYIYGKYSRVVSDMHTDNGFKASFIDKYLGNAKEQYLKTDPGFELLTTPIKIINPARDILIY